LKSTTRLTVTRTFIVRRFPLRRSDSRGIRQWLGEVFAALHPN
jgi:hypothetical protein